MFLFSLYYFIIVNIIEEENEMELNTTSVVDEFDGSKLGWISTARRAVWTFSQEFLKSKAVSLISSKSLSDLLTVICLESPPLHLRLEVVDDLGCAGAVVSVRFHPRLGTGSSVEVELDWPETASGFELHRFLRCAERAVVVARVVERILNNFSEESVNDG